jgi:hypothetical protein
MKTLKPVFTALILCFTVSLMAQTNFSGTWNLNQSKSKFPEGGGPGGQGGPGPMGGPSLVKITQDAGMITVERTMQGPGGEEMKMQEKYTLDGKVSENTFMMDAKKKSTLTWSADKKILTIASSIQMDMGGNNMEMKESETWKLDNNGSSLVIESHRPTPDGGNMDFTMVYDKK